MNPKDEFGRAAYANIGRVMLPILANIASPAPNTKYGAEHLLRFTLSICHKNTYAATAFRAM